MAGTFYLIDSNGRVYTFHSSGSPADITGPVHDFTPTTYGIAYHPANGLIYIIDRNAVLYSFDPSQSSPTLTNLGDAGSFTPLTLASDGTYLYTVNNSDKKIIRFDDLSDATDITEMDLPSGMDSPVGIAYGEQNSNNYFYVGEFAGTEFWRYSANSSPSTASVATTFSDIGNLAGLTVGEDGIYMSRRGERIYRVAFSGNGFGSLEDLGAPDTQGNVFDLTFVPDPERTVVALQGAIDLGDITVRGTLTTTPPDPPDPMQRVVALRATVNVGNITVRGTLSVGDQAVGDTPLVLPDFSHTKIVVTNLADTTDVRTYTTKDSYINIQDFPRNVATDLQIDISHVDIHGNESPVYRETITTAVDTPGLATLPSFGAVASYNDLEAQQDATPLTGQGQWKLSKSADPTLQGIATFEEVINATYLHVSREETDGDDAYTLGFQYLQPGQQIVLRFTDTDDYYIFVCEATPVLSGTDPDEVITVQISFYTSLLSD